MTVYVDDMYKSPMGQFGRMKMSHMIADTEEELHEMAGKIGVARKWYQGDHYDICMSMRKTAVTCGAKEVTMRELVRIRRGKKTLTESLLEISNSVPKEAWKDVPTDLAENVDHYLYGHPKKGEEK